MSQLANIQRGRVSKPPRLLVFGTEGIGKSTFGSGAPKPVFIQTEDGLDDIECDRFPLATSYADVLKARHGAPPRRSRLPNRRHRLG